MNGIILIDKPGGRTSHDVVNAWRKLAGTKRVGHLGTLDPMATGLLVLMTGTATRLAQFLDKADKTYQAEITLGRTSDTYDAEGEVVETGQPLPASWDLIEKALSRFQGHIVQTPPPVSAKKIKGVPAYKLARKHLPVELKPVELEVKQLRARPLSSERLELEVTCTAGTYIRSIAHDLGQQLGCGGLLSALRRTRAGDFDVSAARTLEQLIAMAQQNRLREAVIPSRCLLPNVPAEYVGEQVEAQIRQGREFRTSPFVVPPGAPLVKAISRNGELIAIGQMRIPNLYHPGTVL
jgi:tRNA pseudouridine55 synthase